jgi:hypothetical protein
MKKSILTLFALGLLAALLAPGQSGAAKPTCQVIVRGGGHFTTLQPAVDAAPTGGTVSVKGTCVGTAAITKNLTIIGQAAGGFGRATLDGGGDGPVLALSPPPNPFTLCGETRPVVHLANLTITNGLSAGNPFPGDVGGGILACGTLSLDHVTVTGNSAWQGGGIVVAGSLTATDSTISNNHADSGEPGGILGEGGGGIFIWAPSTATLTNTVVSGNTTNGLGGGIYQDIETQVTLAGTTRIAANTAPSGGGVWMDLGAMISCLDATVITDNTAGGITLDPDFNTHTGCVAGVNVVGNTPYDINDS